jgi:toxin ParE1/3/4
MPFSVQVTAGAERDLEGISTYLKEQEGQAVAERVLGDILAAAANLARLPERGAHPRELQALGILDFRQVIVPPYRMIYRIVGQVVYLYLVADGRRDFQTLLEQCLLRG